MNIKLESGDGSDLMVKQEQFDEDMGNYAAVGSDGQYHQQQQHQLGHGNEMSRHDLMADYADNLVKASSASKRNRKYKSKPPTVGHKVDIKAKLERSRQSARECRARKKLRYQYLEDLVAKRENANLLLKKEIEDLQEVARMFARGCSKAEIEKKLKAII